MDFIKLKEEDYLGKGRERVCYVHPEDSSKVIKVVYKASENLNQNQLEYEYLNFLEKKRVSFLHLSKCFGSLQTNLGEGYVFERIRDFNGKTSKSFKYMVINGILNPNTEIELLNELKKYLLENSIIFVDIALSNIFCQEISKHNYKLIITDGIGGKRIGLKSKLYLYSKIFTMYKVRKQLVRMDKRYKKVVKDGILGKTRLISE